MQVTGDCLVIVSPSAFVLSSERVSQGTGQLSV